MIKKVILAVMIMLFADIIYAQEFFIPDSTRWALFLNEDFNSPTINAQYYKDNNEAKIENNGSNTPVELPALLMDSNVYIQNGATLKLKAQKEVFLENGFEVENGGVLEVNTNTNN